MRDEHQSKKVFGLGFSRTGTTSLNRALTRLGYRVRSYDADLLKAWRAGDHDAFFRALEDHDAFEDWPYPLAFREIIQRFGASARYILTVRASSEIWLSSQIAHAERPAATANTRSARELVFGFPGPRGHEAHHIALYEKHNEEVRQAIANAGLTDCFVEVCWERGDGWNEVCGLVGLPAPSEAFPHENRRVSPGPDAPSQA